MPISLQQLRQSGLDRLNIVRQDAPVDIKVSVPDNPKATGKEGYIRVQWSPNKEGCDGYQVAISTTNNIMNPDVALDTVMGGKSNHHDYHVGNVALTRMFAVRAFQGFPPRFFSDWSSVLSATSIVLATAGGAEPVNPSTVPDTNELPPAGERLGAGGRRSTA